MQLQCTAADNYKCLRIHTSIYWTNSILFQSSKGKCNVSVPFHDLSLRIVCNLYINLSHRINRNRPVSKFLYNCFVARHPTICFHAEGQWNQTERPIYFNMSSVLQSSSRPCLSPAMPRRTTCSCSALRHLLGVPSRPSSKRPVQRNCADWNTARRPIAADQTIGWFGYR